jgi:hypothetical protein
MARVLMATQAWGVIQRRDVNNVVSILATKTVQMANPDGSAATTWTAETGGSSTTANTVTDSNGAMPNWIEEGVYDQTIDGVTKRVQAVSANAEARYDIQDYMAGGTDARVGLAGAIDAAKTYIIANSAPATVYISPGIWTYASSVTKAALIGSSDTGGGAGAFTNQGVPLPVNLAALLSIRFADGAVIKLGGGAKTAFYIDKATDYDSFQHVHFHFARVDNNGATGACHVLIGNVPATNTKQRYLNFRDIHFYGKTVIYDSTGSTYQAGEPGCIAIDATQTTTAKVGIELIGDHNGALESTQTSSRDIDVHDLEVYGGDGAAHIYSTVAARVRPGGCNHFYDAIKVRRWRHVAPTAQTQHIFQTSIYICGAGFGDTAYVGPGFGRNIGDDTFEIGAMQNMVIERPTSATSITRGSSSGTRTRRSTPTRSASRSRGCGRRSHPRSRRARPATRRPRSASSWMTASGR